MFPFIDLISPLLFSAVQIGQIPAISMSNEKPRFTRENPKLIRGYSESDRIWETGQFLFTAGAI